MRRMGGDVLVHLRNVRTNPPTLLTSQQGLPAGFQVARHSG